MRVRAWARLREALPLLPFLAACFAVFDVPDGSFYLLIGYHGLVALVGILTVFFTRSKVSLTSERIVLLLAYLLIVLLYSFFDIKASLAALLLLVSSMAISIFGGALLLKNRGAFADALDLLLLINVGVLLIQFVVYQATGTIIDFHSAIFPFSVAQNKEVGQLDLIRITGLYNEPGTYSTWVMVLAFLSINLRDRVSYLHYLCILSILLTFSVSGYIFASMLGLTLMLINFRGRAFSWKSLQTFIFISFIGGAAVYFGGAEYLAWRFANDTVVDGTTNLKLEAIQYLLGQNPLRIFLGSGFGVNDCGDCKSLQDVGLLFNVFFQLGLAGFFVLGIIFRITRVSTVAAFALMASMLFSKMYIYSISFWFAIMILAQLNSLARRQRRLGV